MARGEAATGTSGRLVIEATEVSYSVANNTSDIAYALYLDEAQSAGSTWDNNGVGASVGWNPNGWGYGDLWAGTFTYDWRPAGLQSKLIASGVATMNHNTNGSASVYFQGYIGATNTQSAGGPTLVQVVVPVTQLTGLPNTPSTPSAVRVNDGQINLTWTQASSGNSAAASNQVHKSVNGGAFAQVVDISATNSASIGGVGANQKLSFKVSAWNAAGFSSLSGASAPVYTTPAAPTNVTATKGSNLNITVGFTSNVAYSEHNHEVWHGVVANGVTTWDAAALTTLASGVKSYVHTTPNAAQVHIYRVRAVAGGLQSGFTSTGAVQLLVAPNKPTVPAMSATADRALALTYSWVHNSVDTSPQSAYEFSYSTNGGTSWTTTGKVASTVSSRAVAANTYAANTALTMRVRTWGSATTGGSDSAGASPWSDLTTVTYKTVPVATITVPASGDALNESTLRVTLGFAQSEGASFVRAQLELLQGATLRETLTSTVLVGIKMSTTLKNGVSYTVRARVQDSNGLWSTWKSNTFSVAYLPPVAATAVATYLPDMGYAQLDLEILAPGSGQSEAATVTITREIGGVSETVVLNYPTADYLTFLDTTPTIHGTNTYTITTTSALGAQVQTTAVLVTAECRRAFLSKGDGFSMVGVFGGNLEVSESLSVASDTVQAAGRIKPIGLYGVETTVQLKVSSYIFEGFGSTIDDLRTILLIPGKACYRDASGRRLFGSVKGSVAYKKATRGDLSFTITETS